MTKNRDAYSPDKINIMKAIGFLCLIGALLVIGFLLTSYQVGPVKKLRGVVLLEYLGLIKDKRSNAELIEAMHSSDEEEQLNAILAMAYRDHSSENVEALLEYLKSDKVTKRMKNIVVWALGELQAQEAKEFLYSLRGSEDFDQYELNKAIKKIEGKWSKPFWKKEESTQSPHS